MALLFALNFTRNYVTKPRIKSGRFLNQKKKKTNLIIFEFRGIYVFYGSAFPATSSSLDSLLPSLISSLLSSSSLSSPSVLPLIFSFFAYSSQYSTPTNPNYLYTLVLLINFLTYKKISNTQQLQAHPNTISFKTFY